MLRRVFVMFLLVLASGGGYLGDRMPAGPARDVSAGEVSTDASTPAEAGCRRIVSLAPSVTETLFALGLGERVVGVTRYCGYPPEALTREKVGGYYDPNYEAIVALKPDLVIILPEHGPARDHLTHLGLKVLEVRHTGIPGILESIVAIGGCCGVEREAAELVGDIDARVAEVRRRTDGLPQPRVMVSLGRNMGSGRMEDVYIVGRDGFYDDMIRMAGGVNVFDGGSIKFPTVSAEGIMRLNPEVIIDMVPDLAQAGFGEEQVAKEWQSLAGVDAVKNGRVNVLGQDYVVIPGPRFILILEAMARAIHPELAWEER